MEIVSSSNVVTITGNIKNIKDFQEIKGVLDVLVNTQKNITLKLVDSISISSSVLGYLTKLVLKDGINISLQVANGQLMDLLDDLNLLKVLKVKKIQI